MNPDIRKEILNRITTISSSTEYHRIAKKHRTHEEQQKFRKYNYELEKLRKQLAALPKIYITSQTQLPAEPENLLENRLDDPLENLLENKLDNLLENLLLNKLEDNIDLEIDLDF